MIIKGAVAPTKYEQANYTLGKTNGRIPSISPSLIDGEVVTQDTLKTKKISVVQTEYLKDSINLINLNKCTRNQALDNISGYPYANNGWAVTELIPVTQNVLPYSWNFGNWVAFDQNKVKLTGVTITNGQIIPSNIKYVRAFWGNAQFTTDALMYAQKVFFGISPNVPDPFIGYAKTFDVNEVEVIDSRRDLFLPFKGKKLFAVGDSYTMQGGYFQNLVNLTLCYKIGDTGGSGNGMGLTGFANNITTNHSTLVAQADIVTVLGGTNDYNHGSTTLGTFADVAGVDTIYGAVKGIINTINTLNPNATIVFFTQPERGNYSGNPVNTVPPALNNNGLNMYNISEAIYDCCSRLGVPCAQLHHTLWRLSQINIYTTDLLHPNNAGGHILGGQMGKFINRL
jgi:lysophospholipase L1-like esterase